MSDKKILEELRAIAIHFRIDPIGTVGDAARLSSVLKALTGIQDSFRNFIKIEFSQNEDFQKQIEKSPKILDTFLEELQLLLVDLKFGSFETSLVPDFSEVQTPIFSNEVLHWKKEKFEEYKEQVLGADYNSSSFINHIIEKYSNEEKYLIFNPLFDAAGNGKNYKLEVWNNVFERKRIIPPTQEILKYFKRDKIQSNKTNYTTRQIYAQVKGDDSSSFSKRDIKRILYSELLKYETYPLVLEGIRGDNKYYRLNKKIKADVTFDEGLYYINYEPLNISVWGSSREEAEDSFHFTFNALYDNFALENDVNLTEQAKNLKNQINQLVNQIYRDEK